MAIIQFDGSYHNQTRRKSFNIGKDRAIKRVDKAGELSEKHRLKEMWFTAGVPITDVGNKKGDFANSIETPYQICQKCGRKTPLTRSEFCPSCITSIFKDITRAERRTGFGFYILLVAGLIAGFAVIGFFLYLLP